VTDEDHNLAARQLREIQLFQARFHKLFQHMPAVMFTRKGVVTHVNGAAEEALALPRSDVIGRTLYGAGRRPVDEHGKRLPLAKQPWTEAITRNKLISGEIVGILLPGGVCRWHQTTCMPIDNGNGRKPKSAIAILTDVTKYRQAQAQLLQFRKMEAVGSLTSGLAHDFNNILTGICSATQLLLLGRNESSCDYDTLKDIENEALRGAELTKQLLLFCKPSHSRRKTTRLNGRLSQLRRLLRRTIPKSIRIELDLAKDELAARIDPTQFEQVILNLAINARDAMPHGGVLRIRTSTVSVAKGAPCPIPDARSGTHARIDVSDTGVGIPEERLSRVFEPFYSSKDHETGTGLGLSIVYAIVQQNKGHISVESTRGAGTTVTMFFPARHAAKGKPGRREQKIRPKGGHETILIVDDEPMVTKSTARFLERYGYRTLKAYDGRTALDIFKKHQNEINLILLDLEMPEMGGPKCLEQILSIRPRTRVIMLSGHITRQQQWDPVEAGARAFVRKPFDSNYLIDMVRRILDQKATPHG